VKNVVVSITVRVDYGSIGKRVREFPCQQRRLLLL